MLNIDQKGMVLSGIALLLVLPALLLSATFLSLAETGGEVSAMQGITDKISFKGYDIKQTLRYRKEHGERLDKKALQEIEESYEKSSILGDIEIDYSSFNIKVEYSDGDVVHATDEDCRISNLKRDSWSYNFEASINRPDYDFNEPLLRLERLKNGNWKVTVAPTFTHSDYTANVYWDNELIFQNVNSGDGSAGDGTGGAGDGLHEGESKIVSGVPPSVYVQINLEDPAGMIHYEETFPLRKPEELEAEETEENLAYQGDAVAKDGGDSNNTPGGIQFSIKNNWENVATINQIEINPADDDINGLSDKVGKGNNDPGEVEIFAEDLTDGDGNAYSDFGGGTDLTEAFSIGQEGDEYNGESPKVESGHEMAFHLYEFYDEWSWWQDEWINNWDMEGEDVTITLTYEVRGGQKTKTFTITPK